jgi:hypothetical protein
MNDPQPKPGIGRLVVERHRQGPALERQQTAGQFHGTGTCVKVSKIALQRGDGNRFDVAIERSAESARLDQVVPLRALAVRVDVTQVGWLE